MKFLYLSRQLVSCLAILSMGLMPLEAVGSEITAEKSLARDTSYAFQPPPVPSSLSSPTGRREGVATRGSCPKVEQPLTALVPLTPVAQNKSSVISQIKESEKGQQKNVVWSQTISTHPSFWFYVPYPLDENYPVEFILQDEAGNDIYQTSVTVSHSTAGVMKIALPSHLPPLAVNQEYHWYFFVYCGADEYSNMTYVEGSLHRINPDANLTNQLAQANHQEKITLLAAHGIWHEPLTMLAQLRKKQPNNLAIKQNWQNLLTSIGLEAIAQAPVLSYCPSQK